MPQKDTIREKYASMPDRELTRFAREEGQHLTEEAFLFLQAELSRRKLDAHTGEDEVTLKIKDESEYAGNDPIITSGWQYAFDQKEYGKNKEEIMNGLIESGLEEKDAATIVSKIEAIAEQRLKKAMLEILTGSGILACGIAITFLPISVTSNRLAYIIAWCAILFGSWKWIKGQYNKSRFKKICRNIKLENKG